MGYTRGITANPVADFGAYDRYLDEAYAKWERGCPQCGVCGRYITDDQCYVTNRNYPMGYAYCKDCVTKMMDELEKSDVSEKAFAFFDELLDGALMDTPHEEGMD